MQTKTTVRYHPTHVTVAIFKKVSDNRCWQGCGEKRTLVQSWWEGNLVQPLWKTVWRVLRKLKIELTHDPWYPTLFWVYI